MRRAFAAILAAVLALASHAGTGPPQEAGAAQPRVVGGHVAPPGAYPWMVTVTVSEDDAEVGIICGGSLIAPTRVLTAAHCVGGATPNAFDVIVGHERLSDEAAGQRIPVTRYALHPGPVDAALLELAEPAAPEPVALATPEEAALYAPGQPATAIGWGVLSEDGGRPSNRLREVEVPIVSDEDCERAYRGQGGVPPGTSICAGAEGRDTCQGDSGGPLIVRDGAGSPRQVGVTSFGRGCGRARFPGVYVEVPAVLDFLTDPDPVFAPIPQRRAARIVGRARVGERLRCARGPWTGEDIEFQYLWFGGFDPRPTSHNRILRPGPELAGKRVRCDVIATTEGGAVQLISFGVRVHGRRG